MDWVTVIAQVINFLILVALLKRFLYGPIVRAMDEREGRIREQLEQADEKQKQADREAAEYRKKTGELEDKRKALLEEARKDAEAERKKRVAKARSEAEELGREWRGAVQREKQAFLGDVRRTVAGEALAVARRALRDVAGVRLNAEIVGAFVERLEGWTDEDRQALVDAVKKGNGKLTVRTAFELSGDDRERIRKAVHSRLGEDVDPEVETSDRLLAGIELVTEGRKVAWTLARYLDEAEARVEDLLQEVGEKENKEEQESTDGDAGEEDNDAEDNA